MEDTLIWGFGVLVGYIAGVIRGRRSIVQEAQELVANAILEVRNYERSRKPS